MMKVIYLCLLCLLSACIPEGERPYHQNELQNLTITRTATGQLRLTCQPRLETLYHYVGARLSQDNQALVVQLIRCPIETICPVDREPVQDDDIPGKSHTILPKANSLYLDDSQNRQLLWPLKKEHH